MDKIDLSKEYRELYTASDKKAKFVDGPKMKFLVFEGRGIPGTTPDFEEAMKAIFGTAYTMKFMLKESGKDFKVMMPETVWKVSEDMTEKDSSKWGFSAMSPVPDFVTKADVDKAKKLVRARSEKKKEAVPQLDRLRLESAKDGKCVQMMQFGPYDKATETYHALKAFAEENGYEISGFCKEIYYNDPHKVPKEKIKTLVRYPVKKK